MLDRIQRQICKQTAEQQHDMLELHGYRFQIDTSSHSLDDFGGVRDGNMVTVLAVPQSVVTLLSERAPEVVVLAVVVAIAAVIVVVVAAVV